MLASRKKDLAPLPPPSVDTTSQQKERPAAPPPPSPDSGTISRADPRNPYNDPTLPGYNPNLGKKDTSGSHYKEQQYSGPSPEANLEQQNRQPQYQGQSTTKGADLEYLEDTYLKHNFSLKGADLRGRDLRGASLHGKDLSGADLEETNLEQADLTRCNLKGANMSKAKMAGANLYVAELPKANLFGSDLRGADLNND